MNIFYGKSASGRLAEALNGLSAPKLMIMVSDEEKFETNVENLEKLYPGVPSIGCVAMAYSSEVCESGVTIFAFTGGVTVATGALENNSKAPARYIKRFIEDVEAVRPAENNTAMIDFCTGSDKKVLSTISYEAGRAGLKLIGANTGEHRVSANGIIYEDGTVYAIIKNDNGRVMAYREAEDSDGLDQTAQVLDRIHIDFPKLSAVFSASSILRYQMLEERGETASYLNKLELFGDSYGVIGYGEHFGTQYLNKAMSCIVFE